MEYTFDYNKFKSEISSLPLLTRTYQYNIWNSKTITVDIQAYHICSISSEKELYYIKEYKQSGGLTYNHGYTLQEYTTFEDVFINKFKLFIVANHNSDFYKLINNQNANQRDWVNVTTTIEHEYGCKLNYAPQKTIKGISSELDKIKALIKWTETEYQKSKDRAANKSLINKKKRQLESISIASDFEDILADINMDNLEFKATPSATRNTYTISMKNQHWNYVSIAFITKHKTYPKDSTIISSRHLKRNIELKPEFKEQAINLFKSFANILALCD